MTAPAKEVTWPAEPPVLMGDDWDALFAWAVAERTSDITIQTDRPVMIEVHGKLRRATRRSLGAAEAIDLTNRVYGANGQARLAAGEDFDVSYEVRLDRDSRLRFRVNATSVLVDGRDGVQITLRPLPSDPPRLESLNVEPEILANFDPHQGLVLVTGPTGSGKSTLLAGMIRHKIEVTPVGKILTYEAPVEFTYDRIQGAGALVGQTEVPRHLPDFAAAVRNAMRRSPKIILIGEARDAETMGACATASNTGHLVMATTHSNGVSETVRRIVSVFPAVERAQRAVDVMENLRLVVTQALVPGIAGGRVALREFLVFDGAVREKMLDLPLEGWPNAVRRLLRERGQTMARAAEKAVRAGLISSDEARRFTAAEAAEARAAVTTGAGPTPLGMPEPQAEEAAHVA